MVASITRRARPLTAALLAAAFAVGATSLVACERKGPAEKAGEKIDHAIEDARDAVDPPKGPIEKLGRKIDRATDD